MTRTKTIVLVVAVLLLVAGCDYGEDTSSSASPRGEPSAGPEGPNTSPESERTMMVMTTPEGQRAPRNPLRVPNVVGMTLPDAVQELRRSDYGCAIVREEDRQGAGRARRIVAQEPRSGSKGFEAQLVHLVLSKPLPDDVPSGCVDQRDEPWASTPPG
jgi:PASTA domain